MAETRLRPAAEDADLQVHAEFQVLPPSWPRLHELWQLSHRDGEVRAVVAVRTPHQLVLCSIQGKPAALPGPSAAAEEMPAAAPDETLPAWSSGLCSVKLQVALLHTGEASRCDRQTSLLPASRHRWKNFLPAVPVTALRTRTILTSAQDTGTGLRAFHLPPQTPSHQAEAAGVVLVQVNTFLLLPRSLARCLTGDSPVATDTCSSRVSHLDLNAQCLSHRHRPLLLCRLEPLAGGLQSRNLSVCACFCKLLGYRVHHSPPECHQHRPSSCWAMKSKPT